MRIRRMAVVGLSLVTAFTFAVAGCDTASDSDSRGNATTPADPATTLSQAAAELGKTTYKVKMDMGEVGALTGQVDAPNKSLAMSMNMSQEDMKMTIEMMLIKSDFYMKFDVAGIDVPEIETGKWMHVDASKLPADNTLGIDPNDLDPGSASDFVKAMTDVQRVDDRTFKGMLDLTKAVDAIGAEEKDVQKLDEKSKKVAFEASIDDKGRLVSITCDLPKLGEDPAHKMTLTYSDFGAPVDIAKPPASKVAEAPADFIKDFT